MAWGRHGYYGTLNPKFKVNDRVMCTTQYGQHPGTVAAIDECAWLYHVTLDGADCPLKVNVSRLTLMEEQSEPKVTTVSTIKDNCICGGPIKDSMMFNGDRFKVCTVCNKEASG